LDNSVEDFAMPPVLNGAFVCDLVDPNRVMFLWQLDSFKAELTKNQHEVHALMKASNKKLTLSNFPFFLKAGISIHYLNVIYLIDKYKNSLDDILMSICKETRLTRRGREVMKDILDAYSFDFTGFHQMMMKTYTYSRLADLKEYSLMRQIFVLYKNHPNELEILLGSKDSPDESSKKLFSYLYDTSLSSVFLKSVSAETIFMNVKMLPRIFTTMIMGGKDGSAFPEYLKKTEELEPEQKKWFFSFLFAENGKSIAETMAHERRLSFYDDDKSRYCVIKELINYATQQKDASIFQNFFRVHMDKAFLKKVLSSFYEWELKNFCNLFLKSPQTKENISFLRGLEVTKDGKDYRVLPLLNKKDLLSKEQVLEISNCIHANRKPEEKIPVDLLQFLWSFPSREKGADFILSYPQDFIAFLANSPLEAAFLMRENTVALKALKTKKTSVLFDIRDALKLSSQNFIKVLNIKDEKGESILAMASEKADKTFFRRLTHDDYLLLKSEGLLENCFNFATPAFRRWLSEEFDVLREELSGYNEPIEQLPTKTKKIKKKNTPKETAEIQQVETPRVCRLYAFSKLFKRELKHLENSTDLREKLLFEQINEKINESSTASREEMSQILSDEWKAYSLDLACFDLFDSQGTPYRVAYLVKNDKMMFLKVGPRRDFYDQMTGPVYRQLMQEANEFLSNPCAKAVNDDRQHKKE